MPHGLDFANVKSVWNRDVRIYLLRFRFFIRMMRIRIIARITTLIITIIIGKTLFLDSSIFSFNIFSLMYFIKFEGTSDSYK